MKKKILLCAVITAFSLYGSYKIVKNSFIEKLFMRQSDFIIKMGMKEKELVKYEYFKNFIEPLVVKAEQELALVRYFAQKDEDSPLSKEYFRVWADYINALFYRKSLKSDLTKETIASAYTNLEGVISKIQQSIPALATINKEEELKKTQELSAKIAKAYYKHLNLRSRAALLVKRVTHGLKRS